MAAGGFLFAMCSATDTFDIALAALNVDICHAVFDGDPADPNAQAQLDFSRTVAFENFVLETNPLVYEFSNIDTTPDDMRRVRTAEAEYFTLFEFSAKYDPVPTMLTQCHTNIVDGFLGQTTAFRQSLIKDSVILLAQEEGTNRVKYIHGRVGKGTFTFYAGHDPEDHRHHVHDPPTNLTSPQLHPNSPKKKERTYRLILGGVNNGPAELKSTFFPAARRKRSARPERRLCRGNLKKAIRARKQLLRLHQHQSYSPSRLAPTIPQFSTSTRFSSPSKNDAQMPSPPSGARKHLVL